MPRSYLKKSSRSYLYHTTNSTNLKRILSSDTLLATQIEGDKYKGVSLTRNPRLLFVEENSVKLILDGNKLNSSYKIKPFSWFGGRDKEDDSYAEEVVLGSIRGLHRFLIGIRIETPNKTVERAYKAYCEEYGIPFNLQIGFDSYSANEGIHPRIKERLETKKEIAYQIAKEAFDRELLKLKKLTQLSKEDPIYLDKAYSLLEKISYGLPELKPYWDRNDLNKFSMSWERRLGKIESAIHTSSQCDLNTFYHGTTREGKLALTSLQTFSPDLLQSRDHGFFGSGFYVADTPQHAKHYGPAVVKVTLKPEAKVLCALEPGKHSSLIPTSPPSYHDEFRDYWLNVISARRGLEYALDIVDNTMTPGEKEFDRLGWYQSVTSWCRSTGYADAVNWLGETVILNPSCIKEIK